MTNNQNAEIARLKEKIRKLEEENKKLKKLIQAIKNFVESNAYYAQQQMIAGGLPMGQYHRYEGHIECDNAIAALVGAEQTPIIKRKNLQGWGF